MTSFIVPPQNQEPYKRIVKVHTVQGIGDLMWVYRKIAPLCAGIKFNILIVEDTEVQKRAEAFLNCLDKCIEVKFTVVPSSYYQTIASTRCKIPEGGDSFEYAVNAWLEGGVHLDDIDDHPVLWDLNLKPAPVEGLPEKYLLVYSSGSSRHENVYQLGDDHWAQLVIQTAKHMGLTDVIFIGAQYDEWKIDSVMKTIGSELKCVKMLPDIKKSMYVIQQAEYFIAYQSGLCMLSEELGTPTFMLWFPHLKGMQTTWLRKSNIGKLFKDSFFDKSLEEMMEIIKS